MGDGMWEKPCDLIDSDGMASIPSLIRRDRLSPTSHISHPVSDHVDQSSSVSRRTR